MRWGYLEQAHRLYGGQAASSFQVPQRVSEASGIQIHWYICVLRVIFSKCLFIHVYVLPLNIYVRLSVTVLVSYLSSTSMYLSNSKEMENLSIAPVPRKREGHTFEKI
jgi:hypothetical protein